MRPKSLLLLLMALGCGLVAAVGINQIMARPSNEAETTSIVVAKREVLKGDLIKPDDIRLQEWRRDALPEGAIEKIEDLQDKRVKATIIPGEPILMGKLIDGKGDNIEIPSGMKAVTVKVDNVSGGAGLIKPGDNVDVLVHVEANQQRGIMAASTNCLLQNVKVIAVDDTVDRPAPGEPSIAAKTVSLLVGPKDAMRITLATEIGNIRLVMRSSKDQVVDDGGIAQEKVGIADVLGGESQGSSQSDKPSGGLMASVGLTPLPPAGPSIGDEFAKGVNSFADLLREMKTVRDNGLPEEKKTWKVVLLKGPEAEEVEFNGDSRLGQVVGGTGTGPAPTPALDSKLVPPTPEPPEEASEPAQTKTF